MTIAVAMAPIGTFWEPQAIDLHPSAIAAEPVTEENLVRLGGAQAAWTDAGDDLRARVLRLGFAVVPKGKTGSLAEHYRALSDAKLPIVLTVDALLAAVHAAMEASLAEVDQEIRAQLEIVLRKLDDRLAKEESGAKPDLVRPTQRAHAIVTVARALLDPTYVAGSNPLVKSELEKIWAHLGTAQSPVLDRAIDYTVFDVARGFADSDERIRPFRAVTWLGVSALEIGLRDEPHAVLPVDRWRTDSRAALVFARLLQRSGEPEAAKALERIEDLRGFVVGAPDDLTPRELARVATNAGTDVRDEATVLNVARVDRVRAAAVAHGLPAFADGIPLVDRKTEKPAVAVSVRLLGPTATPDSTALAHLVVPFIRAAPDGTTRSMPDPLDIGAWLGSREAARILKEQGAFDFDGYSTSLADEVARALPVRDPGACHASVYLTTLEALATYLGPSAGDSNALVLGTEWSRRKLDVTLGAWASLRHDMTPFAHAPAAVSLATFSPSPSVEHAVEPHPEAIGRLAALLRQFDKGLSARGLLAAESPARLLLDEVESLVGSALVASVAEVNGDAPPSSLILDDIPVAFARIEARARGPIALGRVADVHIDERTGKVLEIGTRAIDDLWIVLRDPRGQKPTLYVGPHVGHASVAAAPRMTDRAWRARLSAPPPWAKEHVLTSPSASP